MEDFLKLKYHINYEFANLELLKEALTHRSYAAESNLDYDNQRLEFLGDAVLEIIFSEYLYRRYPDSPEGLLTKMRSALVRQDSLAGIARQLHLDQFIRMGKGELESGGNQRESTLCDLFEALVGAIYLDAGLALAVELLLPLFNTAYPEPLALLQTQNPKGALQEYTQRKWGRAPDYSVIGIEGPDHEPMYKVSVAINGRLLAVGAAHKRKTAESVAAQNALTQLLSEDISRDSREGGPDNAQTEPEEEAHHEP